MTLLTFSSTVYSQDVKLKCGDKEINCINGNKSHSEVLFDCDYQETDLLHLPQKIKDNAKTYLIERVGKEFYNKLNYYSSQVVDLEEHNEITKEKRWKRKARDKSAKYVIQYYFTIQDSLRYYISVVFNSNGNIISKDQLPNHNRNIKFNKIISVCQIKLIAEQDTVFPGNILNVSLEYSDIVNSFVWRIEKPSVAGPKPGENIHRFILLNAVSGRMVKRETETWTSIW